MDHEGLRFGTGPSAGKVNRPLVGLLDAGRRFRLPDGSGVILGRDGAENARIAETAAILAVPRAALVDDPSAPGPTAYVPCAASDGDLETARAIVRAWSRGTSDADRAPYRKYQIV